MVKVWSDIAWKDYCEIFDKHQQKLIKSIHELINNPDASVGVCCSHKVVAVGFNTLCYDASVGVLNPPHESRILKEMEWIKEKDNRKH